jgi:hypothetical protein
MPKEPKEGKRAKVTDKWQLVATFGRRPKANKSRDAIHLSEMKPSGTRGKKCL